MFTHIFSSNKSPMRSLSKWKLEREKELQVWNLKYNIMIYLGFQQILDYLGWWLRPDLLSHLELLPDKASMLDSIVQMHWKTCSIFLLCCKNSSQFDTLQYWIIKFVLTIKNIICILRVFCSTYASSPESEPSTDQKVFPKMQLPPSILQMLHSSRRRLHRIPHLLILML